ncbi:hypothetical protein QP157_09920 [Sphingomonas sp. LR61]|uniref:hypothetical protein n=1 Tax=Sphingomonas sp. LR61 TaxID=3050234 RepID=UPI002FDFB3A4
MSTTDDTLAAVEQAVVDVPGVTDLYRARPTVASTVSAVRGMASSTTPHASWSTTASCVSSSAPTDTAPRPRSPAPCTTSP